MQTNLVCQSCRQGLSAVDKVCLSWNWRWTCFSCRLKRRPLWSGKFYRAFFLEAMSNFAVAGRFGVPHPLRGFHLSLLCSRLDRSIHSALIQLSYTTRCRGKTVPKFGDLPTLWPLASPAIATTGRSKAEVEGRGFRARAPMSAEGTCSVASGRVCSRHRIEGLEFHLARSSTDLI